MTNSSPGQDGMNQREPNNAALDRELDAVLAKFTTAEPRAGLEERILATLRIEQKRTAKRSWRRWPAVAALAAMIVVTAFLAWRSQKPAQNIAAQHPQGTTQTNEHDGALANNDPHGSAVLRDPSARLLKPHAFGRPANLTVRSPRLDQFPSPQPLSQQEMMLTQYVAGHHRQAILIARVRMAELKKDWLEETEEASATSNRPTSDSPVILQENR
jgi:hypothetical protein